MLESSERPTCLGFAALLQPGRDISEARRFFEERKAACLAELGAVPGHDAVRAVLLRILPAVDLEDAVRVEALRGVRAAMEAFDGGAIDPSVALRRHPSWVLLAAREWAEQTEDEDAPRLLAWTQEQVRLALAALSPGEPCGVGEVLWAAAETADQVSWWDHAVPLLEAAVQAPFDDEENRGRAMLVQVLSRLEAGEGPVTDALHQLRTLPALDDQTRVHALWLSALDAHERGEGAQAVVLLDEAIREVDEGDDPEVLERLRATLRAWTGGADGPAEA